MKVFRSLLIVSIVLFLSTNVFPSSLNQNHKEAIAELKECSILLAQEKQRWEVIHSNPVTDKWTVAYQSDGKMIIKLTIDDTVKNIINDQPIQREYTLSPEARQLIKNVDVLFGAQLMIPEGPRPILGVGYRLPILQGVGLGIQTSFTGLSGCLYYVPPRISYTFISLGIGINIWKQPTVALGIGMVF